MALDPNTLPTPSLTDALLPVLAPVISSAVSDATSGLESRLSAVEVSVATAASAAAPVLIGDVSTAGAAVLADVGSDKLTQRVLVWGVVGTALVAGLIILTAALLGNVTANRWIGAAPALFGAALLWVSDAGGIAVPKKATPPVVVGTVQPKATTTTMP